MLEPEPKPQNVSIKPRRHSLVLGEVLGTNWYHGDSFRTAFFNALSMAFPRGEKFFIDSVREFEDGISDPNLAQQVRGFVAQEASHRLAHQRYNEELCRLRGYDLETMEQPWERLTRWAELHVSRYQRLALTVAYEHLTALLADWILRNPSTFDLVDPRIASIWRWHAVEETEHKAVAFDVYRAVGGTEDRLRLSLRIATAAMLKEVLRTTWLMLRADGQHANPRVWLSGLQFLLGRGGLLASSRKEWRAFLQSGFHPWNRDNRQLIEEWVGQAAAPL